MDEPYKTDPLRWRLTVEEGRQVWDYYEDPNDPALVAKPMTAADRYWQGLDLENTVTFETPASTPLDSARNCYRFYEKLQTEDGHWAGEYGGPMFLIPGLAIANHVTGAKWLPGQKQELIRYLINRAHPVDGGWGIHTAGDSTCFGTALNYVALRIMGVGPDHPVCVKSRAFLHSIGGAVGVPAWGKFWLSVLNVYDWKGNNPVPPELWILPHFIPFHPGRMWCHTRLVYLGMSYLYGVRFSAKVDPLIEALRKELYVKPYEEINWPAQRNNVAQVDLYSPHTKILDFLNGILGIYENIPNSWIRNMALDEALRQIRYEDENTKFLDIGPVNKVMNMIVMWVVDGPDSDSFRSHCARNQDFMWKGREGMMMNGTNGSQVWDASFTLQAMVESGLAFEPEFKESLLRAYDFLDVSQIKGNTKIDYKRCYRQTSKGAWPFSTRDQSYTLSDCTAEALKAVCLVQRNPYFAGDLIGKAIPEERLKDAVDVLLSMQNASGGFASYETIRGPAFLEWLNPAEVFGNIMIEYDYVECSTSVVLGLTTFRKHYPEYRSKEIDKAIQRTVNYILKAQRADGSWYGCWAICFTYAMMFSLQSLSMVGMVYENSWALLALLAAKYPHKEPLKKAIQLLMRRQQPTGEWLQEGIEGVFNKNCMISYPNYKFYFTLWALGRYANHFGNEHIDLNEEIFLEKGDKKERMDSKVEL
ncbi:Lanosterol synthase (Oxidosqualene--lanosterol cyclase) [Irineochytrium annulatum]|nr:Lanosterol synthase (Oxidosqualene--lanosterol cyclase) [Irineochytrium annulatum]